MAGPIICASLMFTCALASFPQVVQNKSDVIRLSNVCITIRHNYEYSIVSNIDYFQINVAHNNVQAHIYVGYNPKILDENRKWQSRSLRATLESPKVVPLNGSQAGQFLGVPVREDDKYFHIWFDGGDRAATGPIKEIVGFCE